MSEAEDRLNVLGYAKLAALSAEAASRALAAAEAMTSRLPVDLPPEREPAQVYRPGEPDD